MSASPSVRLSLRRKRSTRHGDSNNSPTIKKSSPNIPQAKKELPSTPKSHKPQHPNKKASRLGLRSSPRIAQVKSASKDYSGEKTSHTPVSTKWTEADGCRMRQPSPDMPFLSSQLCSTQECEVVWDCDSPGFTKDDLKRMHSGGEAETPDRLVQVTQLPHRQLFPHARSRILRASASRNTTAQCQLNDLLDLLSKQAGRKKEKEDPNSHHKTLVPPRGNFSEDSSSSESPALLEPLREASSQPFEVLGDGGARDNDQTLPSDNDDLVWGDDLNLAMCDINDSVLSELGSNKASSDGASVVSKETDTSRLPQHTPETSNVSTDIFDDDLFSDSVILSTQAVEEAMTQMDAKDITINRSHSCARPSKDTYQKSKNTLLIYKHQCQEKDIVANNSVKTIDRSWCMSGVSGHKMITVNSTTSNRTTSSVNMSQISNASESSPQRQVRRSFRFQPSSKSVAKTSSLVAEKANHSLTHVSENQNLSRNRKARGELIKTNPLPTPSTQKSRGQNLSASNSVSNGLSWKNLNTQMTKVPIVKKSLFRSNNSKSEEINHRSSMQAGRGPLLRSQSSGDAHITTSSPVGRRSNSSVELDTSQDLDDDEFFKSLLSMLPEEEGGLPADPVVPLSPIKPENQSSKFQNSVKSPVNMKHIIGNRMETRNSRFIKKEDCIDLPRSSSNITAQNLKNVPTQYQCSVPTQAHHKALSHNISRMPSQNNCNAASQNLKNVSFHNLCQAQSQNFQNVPSLNVHRIPSQKISNVVLQSTRNAPPQRVSNALPCKVVSGSLHIMPKRPVNQVLMKPQANPSKRRPVLPVQGVRQSGGSCTSMTIKPLDCSKAAAVEMEQQQSNDTFDDGLFEDDVLSLIDEVESQFGSQNAPSPSPQSPCL